MSETLSRLHVDEIEVVQQSLEGAVVDIAASLENTIDKEDDLDFLATLLLEGHEGTHDLFLTLIVGGDQGKSLHNMSLDEELVLVVGEKLILRYHDKCHLRILLVESKIDLISIKFFLEECNQELDTGSCLFARGGSTDWIFTLFPTRTEKRKIVLPKMTEAMAMMVRGWM